MDSLTQFVLGAAIGDAVAGRKVGNKAMIWGGIGGTIPDLDVFLSLIYPEPTSLLMHRGFSHSIFFAMLAGPLLGLLLHKLDQSLSKSDWIKLFFLSIVTHPLLDIFTGYGTGLFIPLWDYRIQFDTIFIIDPFYTVPLLVSFVWLLFKGRDFSNRIRWTKKALLISSGYLLLTVMVKLFMLFMVNREIEKRQIHADKLMVAPALFSPLLWSVIIQEGDHFLVGYAPLLSAGNELELKAIASQHFLLAKMGKFTEIEQLSKFSKGYFALKQDGNNFIWNDLRFGTSKGWKNDESEFIFCFQLTANGPNLSVERIQPGNGVSFEDFNMLLKKSLGN